MKIPINTIVRTVFVMVCMLSLASSYAQKNKIDYENDTVKVDGKPYVVMKKKNVGPLLNDFVVMSLSNVELLYFKTELNKYSPYREWMFGSNPYMYGKDELYYKVLFIATGSEANLRYHNAKGFAKMLVENNLVKENNIDPVSEKRFILLNNGYTPKEEKVPVVESGQNHVSTPAVKNPDVQSNTPVSINGNQIVRDAGVIGKFRQDTVLSAYTAKTLLLTIYSAGGEKVAEATAPMEKPKEWSLKLVKTGKTIFIMYDVPGEREKLFRWLADRNYMVD